jgi:hypothetical protein
VALVVATFPASDTCISPRITRLLSAVHFPVAPRR